MVEISPRCLDTDNDEDVFETSDPRPQLNTFFEVIDGDLAAKVASEVDGATVDEQSEQDYIGVAGHTERR